MKNGSGDLIMDWLIVLCLCDFMLLLFLLLIWCIPMYLCPLWLSCNFQAAITS